MKRCGGLGRLVEGEPKPPHRASNGLGCVPAGKLGGELADQVGTQTHELHVTDQVFDTLVTTPVRLDGTSSEMPTAGQKLLGAVGPRDSPQLRPHPCCLIDLVLLVSEPTLGADLGCEAPRPYETVGSAVPGTPPQSSIASVFDPTCSGHCSACSLTVIVTRDPLTRVSPESHQPSDQSLMTAIGRLSVLPGIGTDRPGHICDSVPGRCVTPLI